MNTNEAIRLAGGRAALAELLGISQQATYGWGETLPDQRVWQLMTLRPEWFNEGESTAKWRAQKRKERSDRIDRILQMADEIRREVLAWRNS